MYEGDGVLHVKVFDNMMCRRHYHDNHESDGGTNDAHKPLV
jgi:hypothetical protein